MTNKKGKEKRKRERRNINDSKWLTISSVNYYTCLYFCDENYTFILVQNRFDIKIKS